MAVWARLQRVPMNEDEIAARKRKLAEFAHILLLSPVINEHLTNDEILGYNEHGHFD